MICAKLVSLVVLLEAEQTKTNKLEHVDDIRKRFGKVFVIFKRFAEAELKIFVSS